MPVFVVLLAVAIFPIVYSFYTSLFDINLTRPWRRPFIGFDNYLRVFADPNFWIAVQRTTVYTVVTVAVTTVLAVAVALLLNEVFPGRRLLSALVLLPWATPSIVNGLMWKWIYNPGYGLLNGLLVQLGLIDRYKVWLGDPDWTIFMIANAAVWKQMPLAAILILVTMKAIPEDLYKAAKVDGANVFQRFWHVTLPALKPGLDAGSRLRDHDLDPALRPVPDHDAGRAGRRLLHAVMADLRGDVPQSEIRHRRGTVIHPGARDLRPLLFVHSRAREEAVSTPSSSRPHGA